MEKKKEKGIFHGRTHSYHHDKTLAREHASCPLCAADPGEPCTGRRGPRQSLHQERYRTDLVQVPA
jgi:hypothetical protein